MRQSVVYWFSAWLLGVIFSSAVADLRTDANKIFNWAEQNYSQFFSPDGSETNTFEQWLYRYYSDTDNYLGVNSNGEVWVLGNVFGGLKYVATSEELLKRINHSPSTFEEKVFGYRKIKPFNPITGSGGWSITYLMFLPDQKTVFRDIPDVESIAGISRVDLSDINSARVGDFQIQGNEMSIHWPALDFNPNIANWQLTRSGEDWIRSNDNVYQPLEPLPHTVLNGVYVSTDVRQSGIPPNQFSFAFTTVFTFFDNGQFKRETFNGVFSDFGAGTGTNVWEGTYSLAGYTLKMHLNDGSSTYLSAVIWPGENDLSQIVIGEKVFEKQ